MKLRVLSDYPAVLLLFIWMLGPLVATIYYSLIRYNLLNPRIKGFAGIENYEFLLTDFVFTDSIYNSIQLLESIIGITVVLGLLISTCWIKTFTVDAYCSWLSFHPFS